ncbi:MAG: methyltransferase domain-containing protein [Candidatus Methylomirabilota bacterium]
MSGQDDPEAGAPKIMTVSSARDVLAGLIRDYPLPECPTEARELRQRVPNYLNLCGYLESVCPKNGRLLSVECESGLLEMLLKREYGFESMAGISSSPSPGLTRRLAAFDIRIIPCRVDRDPIPEKDGAFTGILLPRVREHLRSGLPQALAECRRVLTSGGRLVLGTTHVAEFGRGISLRKRNRMAWSRDRSTLLMGKPGNGERTGEPTERELTRLLGEAGFLIDKVCLVSGRLRTWPSLFSSLWPRGGRQMYFIARRP